MRLHSRILILSLLVCHGLLARQLFAQVVRTDFPVTNSIVSALAVDGSTLYIGGVFTVVGPATGSWAPIDAGTGVPVPGFPMADGTVYAVESDGSGGWFIGGDFTEVGGLPRLNLAHVRADLSVAPFDPQPNSWVLALDRVDTTLFVGGRFSSIGGEARTRIGAVHTMTGLATSWYPGAANDDVWTIAATPTRIYIGGEFTTIGGSTRNYIARVSSTGTLQSWNPGASGHVRVIEPVGGGGGGIYVGGLFLGLGGITGTTARRYLGRMANDGTVSAWNPDPNGPVLSMATTDSLVYAGGSFSSVGGEARLRIAAINKSSGLVTSWNPGTNAEVRTIFIDGSTLYLGGSFTLVGGTTRMYIAAIDTGTGLLTPWDPVAGSPVWAIGTDGSNVAVGGQFTTIGGVLRNRLAAIDIPTGQVTAWNPSANAPVYDIVITDSLVYVGGNFTTIGGQVRFCVAALSPVTGLPTAWGPLVNGWVRDLEMDGTAVFAGGSFNAVNGSTDWAMVAAIDLVTGLPTAASRFWTPAGYQIFDLEVGGPNVFLGGGFGFAGNESRANLASINKTSGLATPFDGFPDNPVNSMVLDGSNLFVGGVFTSVGGQLRNYIACVDTTTGSATSFDPSADNEVLSLEMDGNNLYVGGLFSNIGGEPRRGLAALDRSTGLAAPWVADLAVGYVSRIKVDGPNVFVGGGFRGIGGTRQSYLAQIGSLTSGVADESTPPPAIGLLRVAPNPFGRSTEVRFTLRSSSQASLQVYDLSGRLVRTLASGPHNAGEHVIQWDGRDARGERPPEGVYFLRLQDGTRTESRKIMLLR